jgi:hypothetical protein
VDYWVSDINFQNYLITTHDDYIIFDFGEQSQRFTFEDKSDYDEDMIVEFLSKLFTTYIRVSKQGDGTLLLTSIFSDHLNVYEATHRVKLLLGLMNYTPLSNQYLHCTEAPNFNLGNLMYLNSFETGDSIITDYSYGQSTIYIINQFTRPNLPVIVKNKHKLMKRRINPYSLTHISFQLCDKYNIPIVLRSPLMVSICIS